MQKPRSHDFVWAAQEALRRAECTGVLELPSELSYMQSSLKCPLRSAPVDRLASAASTSRLRQSGIYMPSAGAEPFSTPQTACLYCNLKSMSRVPCQHGLPMPRQPLCAVRKVLTGSMKYWRCPSTDALPLKQRLQLLGAEAGVLCSWQRYHQSTHAGQ